MAKLKGLSKLNQRSEEVLIGYAGDDDDAIYLKLVAPKITDLEALEETLTVPEPPDGAIARDSRNVPIKDTQGRPVRVKLIDDPDYLRKMERRALHCGMLMVVACLEPGQIEFDAQQPDFEDGADYFEAIWQELCGLGISPSGMRQLTEAAARLCGQLDQDKADAREQIMSKDSKGNPTSPSSSGG